jgi:hypothetical protein
MWMQGGCKVYIDSYMASNGLCFMVIWTSFKNHLLKVGRTQNQETVAFRMNHWFILFYHAWGPTWMKIHWNSVWLRMWSHMSSHHTWGYHTGWVWRCDGLWTLSFGLSQLHGHGSWFVCKVALTYLGKREYDSIWNLHSLSQLVHVTIKSYAMQ